MKTETSDKLDTKSIERQLYKTLWRDRWGLRVAMYAAKLDERVEELEKENAALRELIVKKGYIVTYFNGTIGLACDPYYKPEQNT